MSTCSRRPKRRYCYRQVRNDILDWHGDHPHTNYHATYDALRDAGFFLEVLGSPLTCFDAAQARRPGALSCLHAVPAAVCARTVMRFGGARALERWYIESGTTSLAVISQRSVCLIGCYA